MSQYLKFVESTNLQYLQEYSKNSEAFRNIKSFSFDFLKQLTTN